MNTNKRDARVVEEIWLIILPESPTVTEPTGSVPPSAMRGDVTVILGFPLASGFSCLPEYIRFPFLSLNSIKTISLWLFKILSECSFSR